ncbi:LAME_0F08174g1_1 [Lachancea meyersii CBS 8951]|uniref:LAME_0F08174g1_1 n=1 Tax=Lachancea meyersii CBS 8951 TaxID=1266667 RepID=A0A1G4JUH0_9SACH|nr:LAME_0F08174g1_1 [Lachancea meyersii CBS 8951]
MTTDNQIQAFETSSEFLDTFQQLQEGEKTAERLEKMLDQLEGKLDELLSEAQEANLDSEKPDDKTDSVQHRQDQ